jgi:hypothetical protein
MWSPRKRAHRKESAPVVAEPVVAEKPAIALLELDHRACDGLEVRLRWNPDTKDVLVSVAERDGMEFEFQVPPTDALNAFRHPYAYAAHRDQYIPLAA